MAVILNRMDGMYLPSSRKLPVSAGLLLDSVGKVLASTSVLSRVKYATAAGHFHK
jgi:hypothetical protein